MLLLAAAVLQAQTAGTATLLDQARRLSAEGRTEEAGAAYRQWLETAVPGPEYAVVLREAVDGQRSVRTIDRLLYDFAPRVPDPALRAELQAERVDLLSMMGRFDEALGAARQLPDSGRRLYLEALLFHEQGLYDESVEAARLALARAPEAPLASRIRHVLARSLLAVGAAEEAEAVLAAALSEAGDAPEAPALLLARVEVLRRSGRDGEAKSLAAELSRRFPASPESALGAQTLGEAPMEGSLAGVSYAPSPQRLLPESLATSGGRIPESARVGSGSSAAEPAPAAAVSAPAPPPSAPADAASTAPPPPLAPAPSPEPTSPGAHPAAPLAPPPAAQVAAAPSAPPDLTLVRLQTGSFRDPENAAYMVRDLEAKGFAAEVVSAQVGESQYHRVLVGPLQSVSDAQGLLVRLKEAGFEGMLYFP